MFLSYLVLVVALGLSVIAAFYSIAGLAAIFAAAVVPIMIMGSILEVAKLVVTVWLHEYWKSAKLAMKLYLVPAVAVLMLITSMGIFGFLSKAHTDQNLVGGDVQAKIAVYDEKIKTSRENIDVNRKALKQMDEAVDQIMGRSTTETGADKAVAVRRGQQKERGRLLAEIEAEQKKITALNEERAPIAAEVRKVEAEVGPIKYIAALIYDDNPDTNVLEKAVRWVIIMLVAVFDPLAIMMLLAATESLKWEKEKKSRRPDYEPDDGPLTDEQIAQLRESANAFNLPTGEIISKEELFPSDPHPPGWMFTKAPTDPIPCYRCNTPLENAPGIGLFCPNKACEVMDNTQGVEWEFTEPEKSIIDQHPYLSKPFVSFDTKPMVHKPGSEETDDPEDTEEEKDAKRIWKSENPGKTVKEQRKLFNSGAIDQLPWQHLVEPQPDNRALRSGKVKGFGIQFPTDANKGDQFLRVDQLPTVLYKYNGSKWIEVDKTLSDQYAYDTAYIDYLISKIESGEYDTDLLNDIERQQVEQHLLKQTSKGA
jgi:hypothetical protein